MVWKMVSPEYPAAAPAPYVPGRLDKPRHCTRCGSKHEQDYRFCPGCGQAVEPVTRNRHLVCDCGLAFGNQDRFCASCGKERPPHA